MAVDKLVRTVFTSVPGPFMQGMAQMRASSAQTHRAIQQDVDRTRVTHDRMVKGTTAGAVILAGGALLAVNRFKEFDSQMSAVKAALKPTTKDFEALRAAAVKAGNDTQYSAREAAAGVTELGKAGVSTKDILTGGLTGALSLAAAGQMEVAEAAEIAASAMNQFGLEGRDIPHIADLLAAGAGKAQGSVHDMGMALNMAGLVAHQTGLSIEETTTALTLMASAGMTGSDAGTSLKAMLQRLTPQSLEAKKQFDALGLSAYDATGNFVGLEEFSGRLQTAMKDLTPEARASAMQIMFGADAVRAASVLYTGGADAVRQYAGEVNEAGYATKQAAALTDNLNGDLERLGGTFDAVLIGSGSSANGVMREMVQTLDGLLKVVGEIPGGVLQGGMAFGSLLLLGPRIKDSFAGVGPAMLGPLQRLRDEMAVQKALGTPKVYDSLGLASQGAAPKVGMLTKASAGATVAMRGMMSAGSGVMSMLGGPWGIAIAAGAFAVTKWLQIQAEAKAAVDAHTQAIIENGGAIGSANRDLLVQGLQKEVAVTELYKRGLLDVKDLTDALMGDEGAARRVIQQLDALPKGVKAGEASLQGFGMRVRDLMGSQGGAFDDAMANARLRMDALGESDGPKKALTAMEIMAFGSKAVNAALVELNPTLRAHLRQQMTFNGVVYESEDALKAAYDAHKRLADLIDGQDGLGAALQSVDAKARESAEAQEVQANKAGDSWKDYYDQTKVNLKGVIAELEAQALATANWQANLRVLIAQGMDPAVVSDLMAQGVSAAPLVDALVNSTAAERGRFQKAMQTTGAIGADALATEMEAMPRIIESIHKVAGDKGVAAFTARLKANGGNVKAALKGFPVDIDGNIQPAKDELDKLPGYASSKRAVVKVSADTTTAQAQIANLIGTRVGLVAYVDRWVGVPGRSFESVKQDRGSVLDFYAHGDVRNGHVAQIAPKGAYRVWAEEETEGEAYIPLRRDTRQRSLSIWAETGKRLGVPGFAAGAITQADMSGIMSAYTGRRNVLADALDRATEELKKLREDGASRAKIRAAEEKVAHAKAAATISSGARFTEAARTNTAQDGAFLRAARTLTAWGYGRLAFELLSDGSPEARSTAINLTRSRSAAKAAAVSLTKSLTVTAATQRLLDSLDPQKKAEAAKERAENAKERAEAAREAAEKRADQERQAADMRMWTRTQVGPAIYTPTLTPQFTVEVRLGNEALEPHTVRVVERTVGAAVTDALGRV